MKHKAVSLLFCLLIIVFAGCEQNDSPGDDRKVVGTGPIVSETLDLSDFSNIENTGVANIYVTIGSPQTVVLKAQQNIIDVLTYEVVNNVMKIGVEKNVSIENAEEIRFNIKIPEINQISLIGVGDYVLTGNYQEQLVITLTGVGNVKAYDLEVGTCMITSTGVGNCEVRVMNELNVSLTGVGNVYYKGNPTISSSVTGLGRLIDDN
jgi:hypothetical protein